jgi:hypothetical protein
MPRDGGFHPFKGRVSKHFGESVCYLFIHHVDVIQSPEICSFFIMCPLRTVRRVLTRIIGQLKLAPDDAYLSCESKYQAVYSPYHG